VGVVAALARALEFPAWFGGNWDALAECLTDLSWREALGWLLVVEGAERLPADDARTFGEILSESVAYWAARGRPFFVAFAGEGPWPRWPGDNPP